MNNWKEIKSIFQKAIEFSSEEERKTFLNQACKNDSRMMEEVESLIKSYLESGDFLESPILQTEDLAFKDSFIGMKVGKYEIEKKIGDGGMAVVYSAVRVDEQFKRRVAIKFIKKGMDTDEVIRRFRIEQQALAGLDHPYIAKIFDGGTTENGSPYFVMELIDGEPIDKYCENNNLTINEKLILFQKVCSAIQYAHQNLVIHRDIKPRNIFVTADGTPKLLDFGIAKLLDSSDEQDNLTRTGFRIMTMEYASPEQFKGRQITTATDIYSLGIVLYEILTKRFPYKFNSNFPSEVERVISTVIPEKPSTAVSKNKEKKSGEENELNKKNTSKISEKDYLKLKRKLSGDIDNIILKAMQKEPERRYSSVEQLSEDIRRHLEGLPIIARGNSLSYRSKKFFERHKAGTISATLIFIIVIIGILGIIYQSKIAANERDKAEIAAIKANKINSFLQNMLSSADPYEKGKDVKVIEILDNSVTRIDSELQNQPEIRADLKTTIGTTYQDLGFYDKAEVQFEQALKIRELIFGNDNEETANSFQNLASVLYYKGKYEKAKVLYEKAIKIHRNFPKPNHTSLAEALNQYGELNMDLGDYDKALKLLKESYKMYNEEGEQTYNIAALLNNIALVLDYQTKLDSAELLYRKAIGITDKLSGNNDLQIAFESNNLASILHQKGNFNEAIELYKKSLALREKNLGGNSPVVALAICNLGNELYYVGEYSESLEKINKAFSIWKKTLPADHPYFAKAYLWLGRLYNQEDEPEKAKNYLLKALKIELNKMSGYQYYIAETRCELGRSYFLEKKYKKAEELLLKNFDIAENKYGKKNIDVVNIAKIISELYSKLNQPEKANKYKAYAVSFNSSD